MKIPKRFKLFGQTIEVGFDPDLIDERDWCGSSSHRRNLIKLAPPSITHPRSNAQIEATFCHEFVHQIFYAAGFKIDGEYAHSNEDVVDIVGNLLHQALTTMEYEA